MYDNVLSKQLNLLSTSDPPILVIVIVTVSGGMGKGCYRSRQLSVLTNATAVCTDDRTVYTSHDCSKDTIVYLHTYIHTYIHLFRSKSTEMQEKQQALGELDGKVQRTLTTDCYTSVVHFTCFVYTEQQLYMYVA